MQVACDSSSPHQLTRFPRPISDTSCLLFSKCRSPQPLSVHHLHIQVAYDSSRPRVSVPGGRTGRSLKREEKALRDAERVSLWCGKKAMGDYQEGAVQGARAHCSITDAPVGITDAPVCITDAPVGIANAPMSMLMQFEHACE
eukprot:scaffold171826_cov17-Tisochrysis_lutea.AAC.1